MTRPLSPNSPEKTDAHQRRGIESLARRPSAVSGSHRLPSATLYQNSGTAIVTSTETDISSAWGASAQGLEAGMVDTSGSPVKIRFNPQNLAGLLGGMFSFVFCVVWNTPFAATRWIELEITGGTGAVFFGDQTKIRSQMPAAGDMDVLAFTTIVGWSAGQPTITPRVFQTSGSNQDLKTDPFPTSLQVVQLGTQLSMETWT